MSTPEQQARDLLERMGIEGAQSFSAGDVAELAALIDKLARVDDWVSRGEKVFAAPAISLGFYLGGWWADRPWRQRDAGFSQLAETLKTEPRTD